MLTYCVPTDWRELLQLEIHSPVGGPKASPSKLPYIALYRRLLPMCKSMEGQTTHAHFSGTATVIGGQAKLQHQGFYVQVKYLYIAPAAGPSASKGRCAKADTTVMLSQGLGRGFRRSIWTRCVMSQAARYVRATRNCACTVPESCAGAIFPAGRSGKRMGPKAAALYTLSR